MGTKEGGNKTMIRDNPLFSTTNQKFNVIILAAGIGSRLKPETDYIPKALVKVGNERAIDHLLKKYQYIADKIIIAVGYNAELLENYTRGKYSSMNLFFSREKVTELYGPGKSLVYALDFASSQLPTIITFCDYVVEDFFTIDQDGLGVCNPVEKQGSVLGTYKTVASIEEGIILGLNKNKDLKHLKKNGFTGISIFHNTLFLKALAYDAASEKGVKNVDYAFDIVNKYVSKMRTVAVPLSKMFEFGTEDLLKETREHIDGNGYL